MRWNSRRTNMRTCSEPKQGKAWFMRCPVRLPTHPSKLYFCPGLETQSMTKRGIVIPQMMAYKMRPKPTALAKYRDFDVSRSLALMDASSTGAAPEAGGASPGAVAPAKPSSWP